MSIIKSIGSKQLQVLRSDAIGGPKPRLYVLSYQARYLYYCDETDAIGGPKSLYVLPYQARYLFYCDERTQRLAVGTRLGLAHHKMKHYEPSRLGDSDIEKHQGYSGVGCD